MGLFNIKVDIDAGKTVPLDMYHRLEWKYNNIQKAHHERSVQLEKAKFNITSILRELSTSGNIRDQEFLTYLLDKYELTIKS